MSDRDPGAERPKVYYICAKCWTKTGLNFGKETQQQIRCHACGCPILYKTRTNRVIQFEAR